MTNEGRLAAIGIGSNSVRLLLADTGQGQFSAIERMETVTRLAAYRTAQSDRPLLTAEAIENTLAAVDNFAHHAWERGARLVGVVATEAVRSAGNRRELTDGVEKALGIEVTVLDGEEEARLGWQTVAAGYEPGAALAVIDIGGASTGIAVGTGGSLDPDEAESIRIGGRTLGQSFHLDEPLGPGMLGSIIGNLEAEWGRKAGAMRPTPEICVVIGGTATVLAAARHNSLDGDSWTDAIADRGWLGDWLERVAVLSRKGREGAGVPAAYTDIIVGGGAILLVLLDAWGLGHFYVSERNILDGYIARNMPKRPLW